MRRRHNVPMTLNVTNEWIGMDINLERIVCGSRFLVTLKYISN